MLADAHRDCGNDALPVCLVKENFNRLVSLWDLVHDFNLSGLLLTLNTLDLAGARCYELIHREHGGIPMPDDQIEYVRVFIPLAMGFCKDSAFAASYRLFDAFLFSLDTEPYKQAGLPVKNVDASTFAAEIQHIKEALQEDMSKRKYLQIEPDRAKYLAREHLFGREVSKAFPSARNDIKWAGDALAVELNTAAVFHLMRVAEHGLRALAYDRRVEVSKGILDLATWDEIIKLLEKAEQDIQFYPKTAARESQFGFYHRAMMEFRSFKNVWRNPVMHTRDDYDRDQARSSMTHVRRFMRILASRIAEGKRTSVIWEANGEAEP